MLTLRLRQVCWRGREGLIKGASRGQVRRRGRGEEERVGVKHDFQGGTFVGLRYLVEEEVTSRRAMIFHTRCYAQPRKKLPERSVEIFCSACDYKVSRQLPKREKEESNKKVDSLLTHYSILLQLYKYKKNGKGKLVKCYLERIVEDFTDASGNPLECPQCKRPFARKAMIHGRPAHKMIGGKVLLLLSTQSQAPTTTTHTLSLSLSLSLFLSSCKVCSMHAPPVN